MLDSIIRTASHLSLQRLHGLAKHVGQPLLGMAYRRQLVTANLTQAFPGVDVAPLVEDFYAALAQVGVEVLHTKAIDPAELRERVSVEGAEALNGRKAVLLMAHHSNWIWAATALVLTISTPVSVIYKTPHTAAMEQLLIDVATRFGADAVPIRRIREQLVKSRQQCRVWIIAADQRPGKERQYVDLCGRPTAFFTGPERIARAMRWPVYYLSCRRLETGRYHCVVDKIAEPPFAHKGVVIERYAQKLQMDIDQAPADWLWSHDRWRDDTIRSP